MSQINVAKCDGLELRILIPEKTSFFCELPCVKIIIAIISFDFCRLSCKSPLISFFAELAVMKPVLTRHAKPREEKAFLRSLASS